MSVAKMADGRWYCYTRYKTWDGKTKQHKKTGFRTKREAQEYEKDYLLKKQGSPSMTFESLVDLYLNDGKAHWKTSTYTNRYRLINACIVPYFGKVPVDEITPLSVRNWQNEMLQSGRKQSTIREINTMLTSVLEYGKKYYGLARNASSDAGIIKTGRKPEMQFYTIDEYNKFISVEYDPVYKLVYTILYYTGMRIGELLALTLNDCTEDLIQVRHTYSYQHEMTSPKTETSERSILIPPFLGTMLMEYIRAIPNLKSNDRIFESVNADKIRRRIKRNADAAGVKTIRIHDFRHSHASYLINNGYSPVLIAKRLGHANASVTLSTYSHLYPSTENELVQNLEECYKSATSCTSK